MIVQDRGMRREIGTKHSVAVGKFGSEDVLDCVIILMNNYVI